MLTSSRDCLVKKIESPIPKSNKKIIIIILSSCYVFYILNMADFQKIFIFVQEKSTLCGMLRCN